MLNVYPIETIEEFLTLKPVWNELLSRSDMNVPFMRFEWFELMLQLYGKKTDLLILLVKDGDRLAAIAPMKREKILLRGIPVNTVQFLANYYSTRTGMIVGGAHEGCFKAVAQYLSEHCPYDLLYLDLVVKDSHTDRQLLGEIYRTGLRHKVMRSSHSPYIAINGTWEEYLKSRTKNTRRNIARRESMIKNAGSYAIRVFKGAEYQQGVADMMAIGQRTWKHAEHAGISGNERNAQFYRSFAKMLAEHDWLNIWILYFGSHPVSFMLNIDYQGTIYAKQSGYDQQYRQYSPGHVLMLETLQDAFRNGRREYDMVGEDEPYKLNLTSTCRKHVKYWIYGDTIMGHMLHGIESCVVEPINTFRRKLAFAGGQVGEYAAGGTSRYL